MLRGDLDRAASVLERGLAVDAGALTARSWPFIASTMGATYTALGRAEEALTLLEQAVERAAAMKLMANQALRLVRLGEALMAAGRLDVSYPVAAQAVDVAKEHRERGHEAYALRLQGELLATSDADHPDRAEEHYRRALDLAERLAMPPLQGHCHLGLGRLHRRQGREETALASLAAARRLFEATGMTWWIERAQPGAVT
jgi:tetratricopeptide (TPR) repeat protein